MILAGMGSCWTGLQLVARSTFGSELYDSKIGERGKSCKFGALLNGTVTAVLRL